MARVYSTLLKTLLVLHKFAQWEISNKQAHAARN